MAEYLQIGAGVLTNPHSDSTDLHHYAQLSQSAFQPQLEFRVPPQPNAFSSAAQSVMEGSFSLMQNFDTSHTYSHHPTVECSKLPHYSQPDPYQSLMCPPQAHQHNPQCSTFTQISTFQSPTPPMPAQQKSPQLAILQQSHRMSPHQMSPHRHNPAQLVSPHQGSVQHHNSLRSQSPLSRMQMLQPRRSPSHTMNYSSQSYPSFSCSQRAQGPIGHMHMMHAGRLSQEQDTNVVPKKPANSSLGAHGIMGLLKQKSPASYNHNTVVANQQGRKHVERHTNLQNGAGDQYIYPQLYSPSYSMNSVIGSVDSDKSQISNVPKSQNSREIAKQPVLRQQVNSIQKATSQTSHRTVNQKAMSGSRSVSTNIPKPQQRVRVSTQSDLNNAGRINGSSHANNQRAGVREQSSNNPFDACSTFNLNERVRPSINARGNMSRPPKPPAPEVRQKKENDKIAYQHENPIHWYRNPHTVIPRSYQSDIEAMQAASVVENSQSTINPRTMSGSSHKGQRDHATVLKEPQHSLHSREEPATENYINCSPMHQASLTAQTVSSIGCSKAASLAAIQMKQEIVENMIKAKDGRANSVEQNRDISNKEQNRVSSSENMKSHTTMANSSNINPSSSLENGSVPRNIERVVSGRHPGPSVVTSNYTIREAILRDSTSRLEHNNLSMRPAAVSSVGGAHADLEQHVNKTVCTTKSGPLPNRQGCVPSTTKESINHNSIRSVHAANELTSRNLSGGEKQAPVPHNLIYNHPTGLDSKIVVTAREKVFQMWKSGQVVGRIPSRGRGRGTANIERSNVVAMDAGVGGDCTTAAARSELQPTVILEREGRTASVLDGARSMGSTIPSTDTKLPMPDLLAVKNLGKSEEPFKSDQSALRTRRPLSSNQSSQKGEVTVQTKKDCFYVKLHDHKLLCLNSGGRSYVLVCQFQFECFPDKGVGSVSNGIDRALRIKKKPLDHPNKGKVTAYLKAAGYLQGMEAQNCVQTISLDDARRVFHYMYKIHNCSSNKCVIELSSVPVDFNFVAKSHELEKQEIFRKVKMEKKSADDKNFGRLNVTSHPTPTMITETEKDVETSSVCSDQTLAYGEDEEANSSGSTDLVIVEKQNENIVRWDGIKPKVGGLLNTVVGQVRSVRHNDDHYLVVEDLCRILGSSQFYNGVEIDNVTLYSCCTEVEKFLSELNSSFSPISSRQNSLVKEKDIGVHVTDENYLPAPESQEISNLMPQKRSICKQEIMDDCCSSPKQPHLDDSLETNRLSPLLNSIQSSMETSASENPVISRVDSSTVTSDISAATSSALSHKEKVINPDYSIMAKVSLKRENFELSCPPLDVINTGSVPSPNTLIIDQSGASINTSTGLNSLPESSASSESSFIGDSSASQIHPESEHQGEPDILEVRTAIPESYISIVSQDGHSSPMDTNDIVDNSKEIKSGAVFSNEGLHSAEKNRLVEEHTNAGSEQEPIKELNITMDDVSPAFLDLVDKISELNSQVSTGIDEQSQEKKLTTEKFRINGLKLRDMLIETQKNKHHSAVSSEPLQAPSDTPPKLTAAAETIERPVAWAKTIGMYVSETENRSSEDKAQAVCLGTTTVTAKAGFERMKESKSLSSSQSDANSPGCSCCQESMTTSKSPLSSTTLPESTISSACEAANSSCQKEVSLKCENSCDKPVKDFSDFILVDGFRVKVVTKTEVQNPAYDAETSFSNQDSTFTNSSLSGVGHNHFSFEARQLLSANLLCSKCQEVLPTAECRTHDDIEIHGSGNSTDLPAATLRSHKSLLLYNDKLTQENRALQDMVKRLQLDLSKAKKEKDTALRVQNYYEGVIQDITSSFTNGDVESPIVINDED